MGVRATRCTLALCLVIACCNSFADNAVLIGPVERVSVSGKELRVLGQNVTLDTSTRILGVAEYLGISQDQHILLSAILQKDGSYAATEIQAIPVRYVPGASEVYISGLISAVDASTATLDINGLRVYFGDLVHAQNLRLIQDQYISVVGKQPTPSGSVWASNIEMIESLQEAPEKLSRSTGAIDAVTQKESVTGTGVRRQSITGTGVRQQSITGTGRQLQSITGTGVRQQSITGTGIRQQSITGTGRQLQSITGTGVRQQSITGTGRQLQSITGTGVRQQSITGTGRQRQSIMRTPALQ